jgi:peptidoglycan/xylan/chitin deacetylase (PgdA/CDA1 family)
VLLLRDMLQIAGSGASTRQDEVVAATPPPGHTTQTASRAPVGSTQLHVRWDRVSVLFALIAVLAVVVTHAFVVAVRDDQGAVAAKPAAIQASDRPAPAQQECPRPATGAIHAAPASHDDAAAPSRTVALTFDDGPGPWTPAVLDVLQQAQVQATFFVVGKSVAAEPEMLQRVLADGHAVGNHSWSHKIQSAATGWNRATLAGEIERTSQVIFNAVGRKPCLFRPPGGVVKGADKVSHAAGLSVTLWSVDTRDWAHRPAGARDFAGVIRKRAAAGLAEEHPVILLHDGGGDRAATVAALPGIIKDYRAHGYRFVTLGKIT